MRKFKTYRIQETTIRRRSNKKAGKKARIQQEYREAESQYEAEMYKYKNF
jgi:hypothetical protein